MFFLNSTAHTVIYPYCHTLPLHAALPISSLCSSPRLPHCSAAHCCMAGRKRDQPCSRFSMASCSSASLGWCCSKRCRSEEHTSELQSLMRLSYAVFCLKKTISNKL